MIIFINEYNFLADMLYFSLTYGQGIRLLLNFSNLRQLVCVKSYWVGPVGQEYNVSKDVAFRVAFCGLLA